MRYKIEFQYKGLGDAHPQVAVQEEELLFEKGEYMPIPDVGDSVSYQEGEKIVAFKVVSRHFSYAAKGWCIVNIVVTDLSTYEMDARLKE